MTVHPIIRELANMKLEARYCMKLRQAKRARLNEIRSGASVAFSDEVEQLIEELLAIDESILAIAERLRPVCNLVDRLRLHEQAFDAINTNPVHRLHAEWVNGGKHFRHAIGVYRLEDSASGDEMWDKPLAMCVQEGIFHFMKVNEQFDRLVHDELNGMLGGVFGEYKPRSIVERI